MSLSLCAQMREVGEIEGAYQAAMADVETLGEAPHIGGARNFRPDSDPSRPQVLREKSRNR